MSIKESFLHLRKHFACIRRVIFLLRFTPRRAAFHKYPFIGRLAAIARKPSCRWSFKSVHIRPSL